MQPVRLTRMQAIGCLIADIRSFRYFRDWYGHIYMLMSSAMLIGAGWLLLSVLIDLGWGAHASDSVPVFMLAVALESLFKMYLNYSNMRKRYFVPDLVVNDDGERINPASGLQMCGDLLSDCDTANNRYGFDGARRVCLTTTCELSDLYKKAPVNSATGLPMVVNPDGQSLGYDLAGSRSGKRDIPPGFNLDFIFRGATYRADFTGWEPADTTSRIWETGSTHNLASDTMHHDNSTPSSIDWPAEFEPQWNNPATGLQTVGNVCGGIDIGGNEWCHNNAIESMSIGDSYDYGSSSSSSCHDPFSNN
jgi:hypothetical protein